MKINSLRITGYQSFSDSGEIRFGSGFNLIVGQNNSGKSALLRSILPTISDDRHRSAELFEEIYLPLPKIYKNISINSDELRYRAFMQGQLRLPLPAGENPETYMNGLFQSGPWQFTIVRQPSSRSLIGHFESKYSDIGGYVSDIVEVSRLDGGLNYRRKSSGTPNEIDIVAPIFDDSIFYFTAERMAIGSCEFEFSSRLLPNASNLAAVLLWMNGERNAVFERLVEHLREVFPTVGNLSVRPVPASQYVEIRIWPTKEKQRVELSFPLSCSGTGVSQVIALLAAIMTVKNSVIVIDEINSFLHPSAIKSLIRILITHYSHHQYIISTHSTDVMSFSNPDTIHLVKREGYESTVHRLNLSDVNQLREVAVHLGVSMSDVFAADRLVWVEGPTEELCFPLLYQHMTGEPLPKGVLLTPVIATGDFAARRRDRELVYQIYQRISCNGSPLLVSTVFSLDSENLTQAEKETMERESGGNIHFLPRRHLECYVLDVAAIAAFISEKDMAEGCEVSAFDVAQKMTSSAGDSEFLIPEWGGDIGDIKWMGAVDAAKLINRVCGELTNQRVVFNKKADTLYLMKRILGTNPEFVSEVGVYVVSLVQNVMKRNLA